MGVHADHWIRRMAREHGMIEPFEEKLVRRSGDWPFTLPAFRNVQPKAPSTAAADGRMVRSIFPPPRE